MVVIPAGDYVIGSDDGDPSRCEAPRRTVHPDVAIPSTGKRV